MSARVQALTIHEEELTADKRRCTQIRRAVDDRLLHFQSAFICVHLRLILNYSGKQDVVKCPICKKPVPDDRTAPGGQFFPNCSERCKLIDLGRWLDGKYQIPAEEADEDRPDEEMTG